MKKNQQYNAKRNTVTFQPSNSLSLKSQSSEQNEVFTGRSKTKYPSLVRFKKLQICSEQSKSEDNSSSKQKNQEKHGISTGKIIFLGRATKKTFTQYRSQRQSIISRNSQKKKTMIPIKVHADEKLGSQNLFVTKRTIKSVSKMVQQKQIQNLSLKSLHSKYTKLKRQASSLWSIPTNKLINHGLSKSPQKILRKEENQLIFLQKQFRTFLRMFEQEQQKKIILCKLIYCIKKQIQNQKSLEQMNIIFSDYDQATFLFTQVPFNNINDINKRFNNSSMKQNSIVNIKKQNKISYFHKEINKMIKQRNLLKSKIENMKDQILSVRKDRVIFSGLFKKIEKQLKDQQRKFKQVLVENRNKLGLTVDVQIGSNLEKIKTIILKQYYKKNNPNSQCAQANTNSNSVLSTQGLCKVNKQQSGVQDTFNLIRNYNSFAFENSSEQNKDQGLLFFRNSRTKLLVKPRKQISSHHSDKILMEEIEIQEMEHIVAIQQFIEKIGMALGVKSNQNIKQKSKQKISKIQSPQKLFSYDIMNNSISFQQVLQKSIKFKQVKIKSSKKQFESSFPSVSNQSTSVIEQIIYKNNSLQKINDSLSARIQENDKQIFAYENIICVQNKNKNKQLNLVLYEEEEQNKKQIEKQRKKQQKQIFDLFQNVVNTCFQLQDENAQKRILFQDYRKDKKRYSEVQSKSLKNSRILLPKCSQQQKILRYDQKIMKFIDTLQLFYEQTQLSITQVKIQAQDRNIFCQLQGQNELQIQNSSRSRVNLENQKLIRSFEVKKVNKNIQVPKQNVSIIKNTPSQSSEKPESLSSVSNQFESILHQIKKQDSSSFPLINPLRHSKGLSTIMQNMTIFQSYQKAMSRMDFENQYRKQIQYGKKKKRTLIKRGIGCG